MSPTAYGRLLVGGDEWAHVVKWSLSSFDAASTEKEETMLEFVFRFIIDKGKQNEFIEWLRTNEENFKEHTRPGWTYLGTWMTVGGFGEYDGESRWSLGGYASLGEGWGDEVSQRLISEFILTTDNVHKQTNLLRSVATVDSAPNI